MEKFEQISDSRSDKFIYFTRGYKEDNKGLIAFFSKEGELLFTIRGLKEVMCIEDYYIKIEGFDEKVWFFDFYGNLIFQKKFNYEDTKYDENLVIEKTENGYRVWDLKNRKYTVLDAEKIFSKGSYKKFLLDVVKDGKVMLYTYTVDGGFERLISGEFVSTEIVYSDKIKVETEEYEMLILVQASCKGAAIIKDMLKPSVDFLASIDLRTGQFFHEKGRIEWLIKNDNKRNGWGYEFEQFGIYRVAVRKCIPKKLQPYQVQYINNRYMLINVLEEHASNEKLEALKEYYAKPISMENELGSFVLDREFSWFEGIVNWNGVEANVYLETDEEDGDTAEQAMKVLKELVDNIVDNDNKYRAFAAQELTELANEWLEDSDEIDTEKITRELFKKRMEISSITVSPDGSLSLFYNDDDMFWGHIIEIVVESNGEIISANIAG